MSAHATRRTFDSRLQKTTLGDTLLDVYVITGATSVATAALASELPDYGNTHDERTDLILQETTIECLPDSKGTEYLATLTFRSPSAVLLPLPEWYPRWDWTVGTFSQRISAGVDGRPIGDSVLRSPSGLFALRPNPHVERELDVQVPCIEAQLTYPLGSAWRLDRVGECVGRCNDGPLTLDTHVFNTGYVLYLGAQCVQVWDGYTLRRDQRHHFVIGLQELPEASVLRTYWGRYTDLEPLTEYAGPRPLPICFATYPSFKPINAAGEYDPAGTATRLAYLNVVQVYKPTNLSLIALSTPGMQQEFGGGQQVAP